MITFFLSVALGLCFLMLFALYRAMFGPTVLDRLIGVNAIGSKTVVLLLLIGFLYERIDMFVDIVNAYPGVTHNYLRKNTYNIWFTFIAEEMAHIDDALKEISEKTGVTDILNLPAEKMFKIKVDFEV